MSISNGNHTYDIWRIHNIEYICRYTFIGNYKTYDLAKTAINIYIKNLTKKNIDKVYDKLYIIPSDVDIYNDNVIYEYCDLSNKFHKHSFCCIF